ncbi:MAG: excinuclease ABC subunit UvrA [Spirochaetales bacterium]|nr:excinuclease ABC subunit UvrA [Spirochaetales bacterium]
MKNIEIKGAHIHNLKNIDVSIPKNSLVAVTGVSGSGKSSLAFDIVFEEGRKQYLQSIGVFSPVDEEDGFESISGIGPAIAVQQNIIRQSNSRSTVGSRSGLLSMLSVLFSTEGVISCSLSGNSEERLPPAYFSYNNANGMCMTCSGKGEHYEIYMGRLVPDEDITLLQVFDKVNATPGLKNLLKRNFKDYLETPFSRLPDEIKADALYGHFVSSNSANNSICIARLLEGLVKKYGEDPSGIYRMRQCPDCGGFRVGEEARRVFIGGRHIGELCLMPLTELEEFLTVLPDKSRFSAFGEKLRKDILLKLSALVKARLGHLSLYRTVPSLSGGELQRLFLNDHLESGMDSIIYVLDEPTAGLHESEKDQLIESIKRLRDIGNTVIVVEHDKKSIMAADHVIDVGPGAGTEGGQIVYQGDVSGLLDCEASSTGRYLSGRSSMPGRAFKRLEPTGWQGFWLTVRQASTNNLKNVDAAFPLGCLAGVAGKSGSGKSSLVSDSLLPLLKKHFYNNFKEGLSGDSSAARLEGTEDLSGYAEVSQAPIGRNMNSTPASYIGIWDKIRKIFASQPEAVKQGIGAGHFSFSSVGACPECGGTGREKIWLGGSFFIYNTCPACHGKRYNEQALSVRYNGKTINDVLEMTVTEAVSFFSDERSVVSTLKVLDRIGMGYIKLGQPTPTLSGGEAQRVKLAREIGRKRRGNILYVLDEPTTGLSPSDTAKLICLLDELIQKGNSVIVVEHDPAVLSVCDWIIELGPEGGQAGGHIIAAGSPKSLKENPESKTGRYLSINE